MGGSSAGGIDGLVRGLAIASAEDCPSELDGPREDVPALRFENGQRGPCYGVVEGVEGQLASTGDVDRFTIGDVPKKLASTAVEAASGPRTDPFAATLAK